MVDDIRPPYPKRDEALNKQQQTFNTPTAAPQASPQLEAAHVYESEDGFINAGSGPKLTGKGSFFSHASKKQKIIAGVICGVVVLAGGGGVFAFTQSRDKPTPNVATPVVQKTEAQPTKPTTEASRLTGVQIDPAVNKRPVTSIQIENSPDARPQSGLLQAGVVFEAIAEGGITRFNASFLEAQPDYIGPVRSVRPYYAVLAAPFDPIFVHAGGSGDGLAKLSELGLKDMDHGANGNAFRRVSDRYAPHNLYTSMADLDKAAAARGYTSSDAKGFVRKDEKAGQAVTARAIDLSISSALYNAHYDYDAASNSYKRSEGGKPHTDQRSGQQLAPKTVVAMVMNYSQKGIYSVYQTTGSGKVYVFQDGIVQTGTWSKASDKEQIVFTDDAGKPLALNAGQTWISLVKAANAVSYTP